MSDSIFVYPRTNRKLLATAIATALALQATGAWSQEEEESKKSRYSLVLEEVVVTAQKREEDFMAVPAAVNAFTAQDMVNTGATAIDDIDSFMPGVEIGGSGDGSTQMNITVRGVKSPHISSGSDPSVATFYDGSYMPRAVTTIPFTDIARTEVLKGPQGTLFGRNATAGVINIVPNKPHDEFEGFVKARLGNQDMIRLEGMVNTPLTDTLALRANLFSHQRDGATDTVTNGGNYRDEEFMAARVALMWRPNDDLEVRLAADYEDRDEMPRVAIGVGKYAYQGSNDPFRGKDHHDVVGEGDSYSTERTSEEETRDMYGVSLQADYLINSEWSVFGIVSYRDWETTNLQEEDGTPDPRRYVDTDNIEDSDIFYSEIRFNYIADKLNLITGANYSQEEVYQRTDIGLLADSYMQFLTVLGGFGGPDEHIWELLEGAPESLYLALSAGEGIAVLPPSFQGAPFSENMDNTGDFVNWGVFIDGTYQLTDTIRIAAGLRYSYDEKEYSWQTQPADLDWPYAPQRVIYDPSQTGAPEDQWFDKFTQKDDWSKTTGRLVADWEFTDYAMMYLSVATGYKSGGFNGQSFTSVITDSFDPEEMTSYEWGLKGDFFENRVRAELALFHHELDGKQTQKEVKDSPDDPTSGPAVVSGDEEADGIELILTWSVTDNLRLTGMTTYRETEIFSDPYYNSAGEPAGGERDDNETNNEYTLKLDWTPEIPYGYLLFHMNYVYTEDPGPNEDTVIYATGPWYFQDKKLLNARLAWSNEDDTIEVALWGNNLLDEEYASNPGGRAAEDLGATLTTIDEVLTWGVDLRYSF